MKKSFFTAAGLMFIALAFSSCQKEPAESLPEVSEPNFTLFAQPSSATKTVNDGLETKWAEGDAINVFHAAAGTTKYVSDDQFSLKDTESGKFDGTVSGLDADASYDWYAFYPYSSYLKTSPNNTSESRCYIGSRSDASQIQTGNDNMSHICGANYPLFGIVRNIKGSDTPSITMQHLTSVIKIVVTNSTDEDLSINSVSFTAGEDIVGEYYIAFDSETATYTPYKYASETANLTVSGVNVAAGAKGTVYMAIKPFTAKTGSTLKLSVNGYEKTFTLPSDVTFTAGHIRTLGFNFDKTDKTAFFNFADPESLDITKPTTGKGTNITDPVVKGDITMTTTDGSTETRIWNSGGKCDFRVYTKGTLKFSAPDGYVINKIVFAGDSVNGISSDTGLYNSTNWTGEAYSVTFTASANLKISSATVLYKKGIILPVLAKPSIYADINSTKDGIEVTWGDVENATKYVVSCTGQADVEVAPGEEYASFTGLVVGQEYTVTVTASADGYKSATSDEAKVTMPDPRTPLSTPTVTADVTEVNSIYVLWQAVSGAKDYTVTCGDNTVTVTGDEYTFEGLAYSTEYTISVVANPADATVNAPSAPGTTKAKTGANPSTSEYKIDFESDASSYTDWVFSNISSKTNVITAKSGSYCGNTGGKTTASITTAKSITSPLKISFSISKQTTNTTTSNWLVQVSSDNKTWTTVQTISATNMTKAEWKDYDIDLNSYKNVYVRISYNGTSAVRDIDDVVLSYEK